jgi:hypothetical protein
MKTREQLIKLFLVTKPHALSYEYRKKHSNYKEDKPVLDEMIKEGLVNMVQKDAKKIVYEYIGETQEVRSKSISMTLEEQIEWLCMLSPNDAIQEALKDPGVFGAKIGNIYNTLSSLKIKLNMITRDIKSEAKIVPGAASCTSESDRMEYSKGLMKALQIIKERFEV